MGGSGKTRTQQADVLKLILLPQPAFFLLSVRTKGPAWASCPDKRGGWMVDSRPRRAAVGKWEVGFGGDVVGETGRVECVGLRARSVCASWQREVG